MFSIVVAVVIAAAPFYKPPTTTAPGHAVLHVLPDHRRTQQHRRSHYGGGYIDGYYEPDAPAADDSEQTAQPIFVQPPAPPVRTIETEKTFPTYSTIVVKGAPLESGCTYKGVMTDDEIETCKRVAREKVSQAK